jgi:hypothetical protein
VFSWRIQTPFGRSSFEGAIRQRPAILLLKSKAEGIGYSFMSYLHTGKALPQPQLIVKPADFIHFGTRCVPVGLCPKEQLRFLAP